MKRYKKIMTIAIVCIMTVVMVACAPTATTPKPDATSAPTKAPSAGDTPATPEVPGIEGFKPFGKRVHITVPVYDRSKEGYPAVDDNYWTRWIQSEFGDKYTLSRYVAIHEMMLWLVQHANRCR